MDQFLPFLSICDRVKELKEREETQQALKVLLNLIEETTQYIIINMSSNITGTLNQFHMSLLK